MIACDAMRCLIVASIPWLYRELGFMWPVYVVAFFVGLFGVFFNSAKMALIPDLVDHEQLLPANAALTSIGRFATVAGIVGGGLMVDWPAWKRLGWQGYEAGFYMDSVSYGISVITLVIITLAGAAHARRQAPHLSGTEAANVLKREIEHQRGDVRQTFRLIRGRRDLRFVFIMVVVLGALAASIYVVLTSAALVVMDVGTRGVGILGGLLAGGMIAGSLLVGTVGSRWDKRQIMVLGCLLMRLFMIGGASASAMSCFCRSRSWAGLSWRR